MKQQNGFTLVEIAIVLVIIGLILGGILKGQELIDSARVRSLSNKISDVRAVWFSFQDRYNSLPGDFSRAEAQIGSSTSNGDGNGKIDTLEEVAGVWQHLAESGFIPGVYDGDSGGLDDLADLNCRTNTCPSNPFNGFYKFVYGESVPGTSAKTNEFYTGDQIPVSILLQLDLKLDDGVANSGDVQSHDDTDGSCRSTTTATDWNVSGGSNNCAATIRGF